jgi:lauroyl/myristoyl acyltransferase
MTVFLSNAFSFNMLGADLPPEGLTLRVRPLDLEEVKDLLREGFVSAVGHQGTADVLSLLLGTKVPFNRVAISLSQGDKLVVFQIKTRLEEGRVLTEEEVRALHEGGLTSFYLVEVVG